MNKKALRYLRHPGEGLAKLRIRRLRRRNSRQPLDDREYLERLYRIKFGKPLDLENPKTFSEKMQWLKLYDRRPEYTRMADKYEAKQYVAGIIGEEYIIPTLGVWERFEDIDFDALPERFVLKCNHDSGGVIICRDKAKLDREAAGQELTRKLARNYYVYNREWPYKNIHPRILAEPYMEDDEGSGELTDYKLHFFSGECRAILVARDRFSPGGLKKDFYSADWEHYDFTRGDSPNAAKREPRPKQLEQMIELGKKLAGTYPFMRTDFYVIRGQIYFGEITFFPSSGTMRFHPDSWDRTFGDWITLPEKQTGETE